MQQIYTHHKRDPKTHGTRLTWQDGLVVEGIRIHLIPVTWAQIPIKKFELSLGLGCLMTPGLSKDIRCHV